MRLHPFLFFSTLVVSVLSNPLPTSEADCRRLANSLELDYTFDVNIAEYLAPDATIDFAAEGMNETCYENGATVSDPVPVGLCRLNLRVETSNSSEIYMEVWLPENWEGRMLTTGNGGLAGCIQYPELAYAASYGFAAFGTNNGHNGTSGGALFRQPEVLEDYAWRSVYVGAIVGKSVTEQYYDEACGKSYYLGCSTGGRQGWKAVQNYPEIFDGVVAGAPSIDIWGHMAFFGYVQQVLGFNTSSVSLNQWVGVQQEVLKQCDGLDGARDGILEDPAACDFNWTPLLCSSSNGTETCLSDTQAAAAAKLFEPIIYNNTFLYPGQSHGFEPAMIGAMYSPLITGWITDAFRYFIYEDLSWDPTTFTQQDILNALEIDPTDMNTFNGDISAFRDRGGKILHWHGTADPVLTSRTSDLYYDTVRSTLNASVEELDGFYRYFRASGVGHCSGGSGANFMGQAGGQAAADTPDDSMLRRIVEWVENGDAPEFVRGTKFVNDTIALGVEFTRKHCKYPLVNRYTGDGDGTDENGWECVQT